MKKIFNFLTTLSLSTITVTQVVACDDGNSEYSRFLKMVDESKNNHTAFLGFIGTNDYTPSLNLKNAFDFWLKSSSTSDTSLWTQYWNSNKTTITKSLSDASGVEINNLSLNYYMLPKTLDGTYASADSFWNDKNIKWQKNIFNWIYQNSSTSTGEKTTDNKYYQPLDTTAQQGLGITQFNSKKDDSSAKNPMFTDLPVLYLVANGQLITSGQSYSPTDPNNVTVDTFIEKIIYTLNPLNEK